MNGITFDVEQYWGALDTLDINGDPFGSEIDPDSIYETKDVARVKLMCKQAMKSKFFGYVIANAGGGKSAALASALSIMGKQTKYKIVEMPNLEIDKIRIVNIIDEIFTSTIGQVKGIMRMGTNRRERLFKQTLYDEKHLVLIIDEAQLLNPNTLRAIKRLWTLSYAGRSPLLSILLFGQKQIDPLINGIDEVSKRVIRIELNGMDADEIAGYLDYKVPNFFDDSVAKEIAKLAKFPLDVNNIARKVLISACISGRNYADVSDVAKAVGISWIRLTRERLGYTKKEFAKMLSDRTQIDVRVIEKAESGIIPPAKVEQQLLDAIQEL